MGDNLKLKLLEEELKPSKKREKNIQHKTLRDEIAIEVMSITIQNGTILNADTIAAASYNMADAMLKERSRK